ncbi:germ cell nuclear acidic protein-like [Engystomops pustulosus]|uniref:germ cell nuclear acidic protein-like n=1 Tax=Engystomops pustulosus TaxID=76066 RepID=UPI003AFAA355
MSKNKRKRQFIIESDDSGTEDQFLVTKKCREISVSDAEDISGDETLHQSHPLFPRSLRSLEDDDGSSGPHLLYIDSEPNSPWSSFVQEETASNGKSERPTNNGFLKDLSSPTSKYVTNFHQNKQELTRRLYRFFNQSVFDNQLPADMEISWNKRLRRQAGRTGFGKKNGVPYAVIHISDKICDSADRLRDTLIHEMCHAACWLIDGEADLTHGLLWDYHCAMAELAHPDMPPITQFHTYETHYKVVYQCSGCQSRVGRWTASLNTEKYQCRICHSKMVLLNQT